VIGPLSLDWVSDRRKELDLSQRGNLGTSEDEVGDSSRIWGRCCSGQKKLQPIMKLEANSALSTSEGVTGGGDDMAIGP